MHNERRQMKRDAKRVEEVKNEHINRGNKNVPVGGIRPQKPGDNQQNSNSMEASNDPTSFANKVIEKLKNYLQDKECKERLQAKVSNIHIIVHLYIRFTYRNKCKNYMRGFITQQSLHKFKGF